MLELLVALTILAIGIVGVLKAFSSSTLTCKAAELHSHMAMLAQQVAGELERRTEISTGQMSGSFGPDVPDYTWEADIQQSGDENFYRAEIRVMQRTGARPKVYRLLTCLRTAAQENSGETGPENPSPNPGPQPRPGPEGP